MSHLLSSVDPVLLYCDTNGPTAAPTVVSLSLNCSCLIRARAKLPGHRYRVPLRLQTALTHLGNEEQGQGGGCLVSTPVGTHLGDWIVSSD